MIPSPFIVYLGHMREPGDIKTSRGLAVFRRSDCLGEFRHDDCPLTLGLPSLQFPEATRAGARTLVLGVANAGGTLDPAIIDDALVAIQAGLNVASGLHHRLRDEPRLVAAAQVANVRLFDVRDPPLSISVGDGKRREGHRLLTVGTDCSSGKMYTSLLLTEALRARSIRANFRATGQTGVLIAGEGVPLDAVVADFISGAIEMLSPARYDGGWDIIEGQGSVLHPAFAGVSTGLLHGAQPDALVMCHDPARTHLRGFPHWPMPDLIECMEANMRSARLTNPCARMLGIALNTSQLEDAIARRGITEVFEQTGLPTTDPFRYGARPLVEALIAAFESEDAAIQMEYS